MSKYDSLFEVRGKIGAITFRKVRGALVVGRTSKIDAQRIAKSKEFKRTRENNREFKGSANAGKSLRMGLANVTKRFADSVFSSRLTAAFNLMVRSDTGIRGQRPILVVTHKSHLIGTDFEGNLPLAAVFVAPRTLTVNAGRNSVTLDIPTFSIDDLITAPDGATHWRVVLAIVSLSDHEPDAQGKGYVPVNVALNSLSGQDESAWNLVSGTLAAPMQLVATLPNNPVMTATTGLVACVGIEFSQAVGSNYYVFAQKNAMRIEEVY
jgi:hypothetical protein